MPKHPTPPDSLSLILPVRNAEQTLADRVGRLLDLLPDLTARFEIVVVDDGSSDATADVARDLARNYPQLRLIRHDRPHGLDIAASSGLQAATGSTILVQEDAAPLSPTNLRRLWSLRHDDRLVMARTQQRPGILDPDLLERLSTWGQSLRELAKKNAAGGIQMIRRDAAIEQTSGMLPAHTRPAPRLPAPLHKRDAYATKQAAYAPADNHRVS